ncbi:MAG: hypothetical protein E7191_05995 [Erysipelotrichaceae bacterium]|nr:hypothetical protein [Erysipelotrichaceae bacterium]
MEWIERLKRRMQRGISQRVKPSVMALRYEECLWLKDLLQEGIVLSHALELLKSDKNKEVIERILESLERGETEFSYFFPKRSQQRMFQFFLNLYPLDEALSHCLVIESTKRDLVKRTVNKLLYPLCILVLSCLCITFVCLLVMPRILSLMEGMGLMIDHFLYYMCIGLCAGIFLGIIFLCLGIGYLYKIYHDKRFKEIFDRISVVWIKRMFQSLFTYIFCTYFNVLLKQQVSTKEALYLLCGIQDGICDEIGNGCMRGLESGKELVVTLEEGGWLLPGYISYLRIGESCGRLVVYSDNYEKMLHEKIEHGIKFALYVMQGFSYGCVGVCAVVIMQMMLSPLELFELL